MIRRQILLHGDSAIHEPRRGEKIRDFTDAALTKRFQNSRSKDIMTGTEKRRTVIATTPTVIRDLRVDIRGCIASG